MTGTALKIPHTAERITIEDVRHGIACDEREYAKLWPTSPIYIDAYDILDLDDPHSIEIINCILQITAQKEMKYLIVLNVDDLLQTAGIDATVDRFYALKRIIQRACDQLRIGTAQLQLERTATGLDLRVRLRMAPTCTGNVISLETERRRRYLARTC